MCLFLVAVFEVFSCFTNFDAMSNEIATFVDSPILFVIVAVKIQIEEYYWNWVQLRLSDKMNAAAHHLSDSNRRIIEIGNESKRVYQVWEGSNVIVIQYPGKIVYAIFCL